MTSNRNKSWLKQVPKLSWRKWLKTRPSTIPGIEKTEIYSSRIYPYDGSHEEYMEAEFKALGWNDDPTTSEKRIMRMVRAIMSLLIRNWESAETAFHVLNICNRILHYKTLSPLTGADCEFSEADERGNERNTRNPCVKRFKEEEDGEMQHWAFSALISVWPNGKRYVEPGNYAGIPLYSYPVNPPSQHVILRETMADPNVGSVVTAIYNGNLYHVKKSKRFERGEVIYTYNRRESVAI